MENFWEHIAKKREKARKGRRHSMGRTKLNVSLGKEFQRKNLEFGRQLNTIHKLWVGLEHQKIGSIKYSVILTISSLLKRHTFGTRNFLWDSTFWWIMRPSFISKQIRDSAVRNEPTRFRSGIQSLFKLLIWVVEFLFISITPTP